MNTTPAAIKARAADPRPPRRVVLPYWLREFALIRTATATFAVTVVIVVSCVLASYLQLVDARRDERTARAGRDAARLSYLHVEAEKEDIRVYQPLYTALRRRGFIGTENRLDWVDAIRQIQEQRHLLPLTYEIYPQQPYKLAGRIATGEYQLRGSRMALHMDLLHELDLFNFLGDLRQRGVFTVQDCTLRRAAGAGNAPLAPGLTGDCTLNWLTLTPPVRRVGAAR